MRERTTWNREEVMKKASTLKVADPYTMNQDHPQPPADKYVTGDPSSFAEDVHSPNTWESEYANGQTKRDEIGMPEMRSDTFNHSEKTAKEILLKKADLCIAVAQLMLGGKKLASEVAVEDQAVALMHLPDSELLATHARLAADQDDEDSDDGSEGSDEQQTKQAQDQDQSQESEDKGEQQAKQAEEEEKEPPPFIKEKMEESKQAQDQSEEKPEGEQEKQAAKGLVASDLAKQIVATITANLDAQVQQMIQQAMGQMQQQAPAAPQQQAQQQMQVQDEQTLDQMLAADGCGPMAEADIQMEPAPMDVGMGDLGPEDEMLRSLFADEEEGGEQEEGQQKQAGSVRTASARTVGTRPTGGVSKLGGAGSAPQAGGVDQLSSLWQSAPDVRDAFGLK